MIPRHQAFQARALAAVLWLAAAASIAGCSVLVETPPAPTPADFQGIAADLVKRGIRIDNIVSGDAGCPDQELARTAIGLDAEGLDQTSPTRLFLYIFRNRDAYDRLRQTVDACARSYVIDPEALGSVEISPFVVTGPGPWAPQFQDAVRAAITEAAGTGN